MVPNSQPQIVSNAVKARVLNLTDDEKVAISELLSYTPEGAERSEAFKAGRWDGRSSFFDYKSGGFPAGFAPLVARKLTQMGREPSVASKPAPPPAGLADPDFENFDGRGGDPRYDYQHLTVRRLIRHKRMIAQCATGAGKSRIAAMTYAAFKRPTLFLTTRSVLMHQMAKSFVECGFDPGFMGDGLWTPKRSLNVGMVQTITAKLSEDSPDREKMMKILNRFELVIGEEAHEAGGNSYFDILNQCNNAHYRLALTATPFMRTDGEANMRLMATFGLIGITVSEKTLIDRGILATPYFKIIKTPDVPMLRRSTRWPSCYDVGIVENHERNKLAAYEAARAAKYGLPVLILTQRRRHGEILAEMLKKIGVSAEYIFGDSDQNSRQDALKKLKDRQIDVLIGSTILDVGVDVPSIGMVILAGGGKAEVGTRQRIGRGLRGKKTGNNFCFVVDFDDTQNKILHTHALTRRSILENTPGFGENILQQHEDFDYGK